MKKLLSILTIVLLLASPCFALSIDPKYNFSGTKFLFDWQETKTGNIFKVYLSDCAVPTSDQNIFAARITVVYKDNAKDIVDTLYHLGAGPVNKYALYSYDAAGNKVDYKNKLKNGDVDPDLWYVPNTGSIQGYVIQMLLKGYPICGGK